MNKTLRRRGKRQKKRIQHHKRSVMAISAVLLLMVATVVVKAVPLQAREQAYIAQETELEKQLEEEEARAAEIDELEEYVGTDEYVEDVAREKLGLVYEDEIIFKAK